MGTQDGGAGDVRGHTFAVRMNSAELRMLATLARELKRTRSDAIRLLVREALRQVTQLDQRQSMPGEPTLTEVGDGR